MLFNAMKAQKALSVSAATLVLATFVYMRVNQSEPESDAPLPASVWLRDHDGAAEGKPDLFV